MHTTGVCMQKGKTPLSLAAWNGHDELVKSSHDKGSQPDSQTSREETPLYLAAYRGQENAVKRLLATDGVDSFARNMFPFYMRLSMAIC